MYNNNVSESRFIDQAPHVVVGEIANLGLMLDSLPRIFDEASLQVV